LETIDGEGERVVIDIVFDLDNTLVDSSAAYEVALSRVALDSKDSTFLTARTNVKERLGHGNPSSHNRLLYFKELLEIKGQFSPQLLLSMMDKYEAALEAETKRQWESLGRTVLMKHLGAVARLHLLTNENLRTQAIKLRAMDPNLELFRNFTASEDMGVEKPAALEKFVKLRRIDPSKCWMVGDSLEDDCLPAQSLGMRAILTREFSGKSQQAVGFQAVERLEDLKGLFLGANL
jgi:FMN phosphatase YigB (HAD superfamily)